LCCEIKGSSLLFWVARCQWVQNRDGTVPSCFSTCVCVCTHKCEKQAYRQVQTSFSAQSITLAFFSVRNYDPKLSNNVVSNLFLLYWLH
jgi:hypothetical protein